MGRSCLLAGIWLFFSPTLLAYHVFHIPHLAGDGWRTSITVFNEGDRQAPVILRQWNNAGIKSAETAAAVPAHGRFAWTPENLLQEGLASISTEEDKIRVKLGYQFGYSQSICEFFVSPDDLGSQWLLPNSSLNPSSWFGITVANPGTQTTRISVTAFKDGVEARNAAFTLKPGRRRMAASTELWGLEGWEVDAVLVASDKPIPSPLALSGTPDQSRHALFPGDRIDDAIGERRFFVPHIAGDPWITQIVVYNLGAHTAAFSLHQFDNSGTESATITRKVHAGRSLVIATDHPGELTGSGSALITGRGTLSVKYSFRYGTSESLCEFFAGGDTSRRWFLPNPTQSWFDWYGIAIQNPAASSATAAIRAFKDGIEVGKAQAMVGPRQTYAVLSEQSLNLDPREFDMVLIETNQPVPQPLSITGNQAQDRHLFFGGQPLSDPIRLRKWVLLYYADAEFTNGYNPTRDFALEAYSGPNLDVLILEDTMNTPTSLLYVNPNRSLALIEPPMEKNMGDPNTLYDFIMKAKTEYPAERYILAFYDHGFGWQGCCLDQTSEDMLTMDEIQGALTRAGGVDLTLFASPCLMGAFESIYELRDTTDVYVGSEDLSGLIWFGTIQFIRSTLVSLPDISSRELGRRVVDSIAENMPANDARLGSNFGNSFTMSAIDTRAIHQAASSLNELCEVLLEHPQEVKSRIYAIWSSVQHYDHYSSIDLYDFLEKYAALEGRPAVQMLIRKVQESLRACVLAERHGPGNPGSHGLSIYFPLHPDSAYSSLYSDPKLGLDFAAHTQWDELVKACKSDLPGRFK